MGSETGTLEDQTNCEKADFRVKVKSLWNTTTVIRRPCSIGSCLGRSGNLRTASSKVNLQILSLLSLCSLCSLFSLPNLGLQYVSCSFGDWSHDVRPSPTTERQQVSIPTCTMHCINHRMEAEEAGFLRREGQGRVWIWALPMRATHPSIINAARSPGGA